MTKRITPGNPDPLHRVIVAFSEGREARSSKHHTESRRLLMAHTTALDFHQNRIAELGDGGTVHVTLAGWNTPTTRSRVEDVLNVCIPGRGFRVGTCRGQASLYSWGKKVRDIGSAEWICVRDYVGGAESILGWASREEAERAQ